MPRQQILGPEAFRLLNRDYRVATAADWNRPDWPALAKYQLHYFDDLSSVAEAPRTDWQQSLIRRWLAENPPGSAPGWDAFPSSLRIVNWIKWILGGNAAWPALLDSLACQAEHLSRNVEWHLLGNHVLANAKALIFAGQFFTGRKADRWFRQGCTILDQQIREQILGDGGHFERSPMYHAVMLEDLLDLHNALTAWGHPDAFIWRETVTRMQQWLVTVCHPDGQYALLNDSAFNGSASPAELAAYAARLGYPASPHCTEDGVHLLSATGYARCQFGPWTALVDAAPIGPDYQPGHAHADTLSFELSLHKQRLLVDSGTGEYGSGPARQWQRGTPAHNTLTVDGKNSSDVWSAFRVGRRARIVQREVTQDSVLAAHDGFEQQGIAGRHRRRWTFTPQSIEIEDVVEGSGKHRLEVFFHLHPAFCFQAVEGNGFAIHRRQDAEIVAILILDSALEGRVQPTTYHAEFGSSEPKETLVGTRDGALPAKLTWCLQAAPRA